MGDFKTVGQQFVNFYYSTFDSGRANLAGLYRDTSMLSFEASEIMGTQAIIEKLSSLPFQKVQHRVDTMDTQPSNSQGGLMVLVTGALLVDDSTNPLHFCQVFQLLPHDGSYYVQNDVFRLNYG
ncbi:nuclear transport factor NTF-2 [Dacryopinax primogenitus]|uniref:Nuclear transport factor 2 n=1 Tax=Dacryopinax primogenitus (strain DJM 731) TaxID=1858805 RepID=M5GAW1_DACPD|nr:nuclear transport factor NTF-2 [Dacryopinax primogenitus]EJU05520.1 nuclear transport factor NTF-2 [Dacryopinax primogenitus]